ncbi:MAG: SDR family oxidoreductase [Labedaea sp.]
MTGVRRRLVDSDGLRISVREEGDPNGPTLVLVHGYPDNSSVWDGVVARLADGFRIVRYDLRGHGDSDAPKGRAGYLVERLVADLVAVLDATSPGRPVHLVAHDWGSMHAWAAVTDPEYQARFASFTTISGPDLEHIRIWMRTGLRSPRRLPQVLGQVRRSWYMAAFQLPVIPELLWRLRAPRNRFQARYRDASNGVQLYRANMPFRPARPVPARTPVPILQVALTKDRYCLPALLTSADPWCERLWRRELAAGHWAVRDEPDAVARMVREFVDHVGGRPAGRELARARVGGAGGPMTGRLVLVTGAGNGIGAASALAFASAGADVLCVDLDQAAAGRTAAEVTARGRLGVALALDVADGAATRLLAETVAATHGVPDVLMANAGIGVAGPFLATSEEDWRRVLDVNLWGVVHTLRAFLPAMVARGEGGHLVVTASMAGYLPTPTLPAYSTTKAGVLMLAQCLAGELRPAGIGVSAICPGVVHTNITRTARFAGATPEQEEIRRRRATAAYRRRGYPPEKVARAVLRAVVENRLVVPVTPEANLAALGNRVSPTLTRAAGRWLDGRGERATRSPA